MMVVTACAPAAAPPPATAASASTVTAARPRPRDACETPGASLGTVAERASADIVKERGTGVDSYQLQDGVWLAHAPVLVNEDFDFSVAMGLGAVGAGIAARQRMDHNAARAAELEGMALSEADRQTLDALRACGIHRWALSWGGQSPVVRLVSDHYDASGKLTATQVKELPAAALREPGFWQEQGDEAPTAVQRP